MFVRGGPPLRAADPAGAAGPTFRVTVLRAPGKRLVKTYLADGGKRGTDKAASFLVERPEVRGARGFFALLSGLERHPDRCVIRGAPGRWFPADGGSVHRLLHPQPAYADARGRRVTAEEARAFGRAPEVGETLFDAIFLPAFGEEATCWVLLDLEGVEFEPDWRRRLAETAAWLKLRLPDPFADASCWYQATGGAADPSKPDLGGAAVRMRLGFVLSRPLTRCQLEAWLGGIPGLDACTFRTVQEIYVGRPVFEGGVADPMPVRSGVLEGLEDVVQVPDDLPEPRAEAAGTGYVPAASELGGADGVGLLDCPRMDDVLADITGESGGARDRIMEAAFAYVRHVGTTATDTAALAARLAEAALHHRGEGEVAGYGIPSLITWVMVRVAAQERD